MTTWAWRLSLVLQVIVIWRMARSRRSPALVYYLGFDLARSAALAIGEVINPGWYAPLWRFTEPLSAGLLWLVCSERAVGWRGWYRMLPSVMLFVAVFGVLVEHRQAALAAHAALCLTATVIAIGPMAYQAVFSLESLIFAIFFGLECVTYLGIILGADNDLRPAKVMIYGQSACLLAWLIRK